jgi:outer membrane receptor protein involved in Fe transport
MTRRIFTIACAIAGLLLASTTALAQNSTTGAIRGVVKDTATGQPMVAATVVVTSVSLQQPQTQITDSSGVYYLSNLPPGTYLVTVHYAGAQFSRKNVLVSIGKVAKVNLAINSEAAEGEVIEIEGTRPIIDQQSTKTGVTITRDYTENVPVGRTFGAVLGAAAGSQGDLYGVSFGGSTSNENTYIVEGLNTTDPGFGLLSTNLPNEFILETEVITGGYGAEYGRSTGGVINVVTKAGSNEFHGSVFGYFTPGALVAAEKEIPSAGTAIFRQDEVANVMDVGAELGGPVIKDKVWFHVGFNPSFGTTNVNRSIRTQVDEDNDGIADVDDNGFAILEEIDGADSEVRKDFQQKYYFTTKLTGAVDPNNQGSLSVLGSQRTREAILSTTGARSAGRVDLDERIVDVAGKWTSKFNNNNSQVDVVVGIHTDVVDQTPGLERGGDSQVRYETSRSLMDFARFENNAVPTACNDSAVDDPYPMITNCPVPLYRTGGVGFLEDEDASRIVGNASFTQRVNAGGHHEIKFGAEIEEQKYKSSRQYTGEGWFRQRSSTIWTHRTFQTVSSDGDIPCGPDLDGDMMPDALCATVDGDLTATTRTRNYGLYLRDSWSIRPNLTLNAGVRWEKQTLFASDEVQGEVSNVTGQPIPDVAFDLSNMIAPRVGVVYDWTEEGRSKVYGHWGRFYESIPMDINVRAYGGEIIAIDVYDPAACPLEDPVGNCDPDGLLSPLSFGDSDVLHDPGLKAQYLDEYILGVEYEVIEDFKVGVAYIHRGLGRVIEDVSTDGAHTYVVSNPGEVHQDAIDDLRAEADAIRGADPGRADYLDFQADNLEGVGIFDAPHRKYDALQLTADKRFNKDLFVQASYTYSQLKGNFPGLFSPETGQLDPNLTSMFDLPELMANRYGPLAADRPHQVKVDGYYLRDMEGIGRFIFGLSARASSGIPHTPLAASFLYGREESYLLPRGSEDRSPFLTRFDVKVAYGRNMGNNRRLDVFVDFFNVLNQQTEVNSSDEYTLDEVNPIVGGDMNDLAHAKVLGGDGTSTAQLVTVEPNYGNVSSRQTPLSIRLGVRLTF